MSRSADALVQMTFTGIPELDKLFLDMPEQIQKKALRPAARAVAKMVLEQAKAEVPEDTGLLRSELRIRAKKRSRRYPHTIGMTIGFADDLFKGDTFYAGMLEFGTTFRFTKSRGGTRNRSKPKYTGKIDDTRFAFLRPALWSYPERKQAIFRQSLVAWLSNPVNRVKYGKA